MAEFWDLPGFKYAEKDRRDAPVSRCPRVEQQKPRLPGRNVACFAGTRFRLATTSCPIKAVRCAKVAQHHCFDVQDDGPCGWQGRRRRQLVRLLSEKIGSPAPVREPPVPIGQALHLTPHLGALLGSPGGLPLCSQPRGTVWVYLSFPTTPPGLMAPPALHKGLSGECRFRYSFVHAYNFTDGEVQCPLRLNLKRAYSRVLPGPGRVPTENHCANAVARSQTSVRDQRP